MQQLRGAVLNGLLRRACRLSTLARAQAQAESEAEVLVQGSGCSRNAILNRPSALNAFNDSMAVRLKKLYEGWEANPDVGLVVIKGRGRAFCAGGDIVKLYQWANEGSSSGSRDRKWSRPFMACVVGSNPAPSRHFFRSCFASGFANVCRSGSGYSGVMAYLLAIPCSCGAPSKTMAAATGCMSHGMSRRQTLFA